MLENYQLLTVTYRQTPIHAVGEFVVPYVDDQLLKTKLESLKARFGLQEMLYLATCNRVVFLFHTNESLPESFKTAFFQAVNPALSPGFIEGNAVLLKGKSAIDHLFRMASSIESLVVGEREILRQLKESYQRCSDWELTGDHLRILVQAAVLAAKAVYHQTRLGEKSVSVVSLAIRELMKTPLPKTARILMIGAGQTNLLMAKFLTKYGFQYVTVFNRSYEKALQLAGMLKGKALPIEELSTYSGGFDCLIACTGSTCAVVDKWLYARLLAGETDRKVVIDLSVPNNVSPAVVKNFNLHFIEMEGLRAFADENLAAREQEVAHACVILERHVAEFEVTARKRSIERALHKIPLEVKAVKERAMNEVFKKEVEVLDDGTRQLLERMLTYMELKCTGIPMKLAKEALV